MHTENSAESVREKLIIILGPTAVGKTRLSLEVAAQLNTEIISGDSMQVYRGMDIGTAKIMPAERVIDRADIPHYLIDILDPDQYYSVADFQSMARDLITKINRNGKIPVVAGGTGLYIDSLYSGYLFPADSAKDPEFTKAKEREADVNGLCLLYEELCATDPAAALLISKNDRYRIIRALEVYHLTGRTITEIKAESRNLLPAYDMFICGLNTDRDTLYANIDRRVDEMLANGLIREVKGLLACGYPRELKPMKGIGYKHICDYLFGEATLEEAVRLLKRDTRRFAKRQLTWFRKNKNIRWFDLMNYADFEELKNAVILEINDFFESK